MATNNKNLLLTPDDFPSANFPEFYDDNLMDDVLLELNKVIQDALAEPNKPKDSEASNEELMECLRSDIMESPYLYLSGSLINKLNKI